MFRRYFYARWSPPDDFPAGTRLDLADARLLDVRTPMSLVSDPTLFSRHLGMPLRMWRVHDVRASNSERFVKAATFTIGETVPSWRWLGVEGQELLAIIDRTVATVTKDGAASVPTGSELMTFRSAYPVVRTNNPRVEAHARFVALIRRRLVAEAGRLEPEAVTSWENDGCAGWMQEDYVTGRWALAELTAIDEARESLRLPRPRW